MTHRLILDLNLKLVLLFLLMIADGGLFLCVWQLMILSSCLLAHPSDKLGMLSFIERVYIHFCWETVGNWTIFVLFASSQKYGILA